MSGYLRTFKHKDKNKDNKMSGYAKTFKDNELMPFHVDHCQKSINLFQTNIKDLQNHELNTLLVYTNFRGLDVAEDGVKCECFTMISISSLLVYEI